MYQNEDYSSQYQLDSQMALNAYLTKVFGIMFVGLFITAATAFFAVISGIAHSFGRGVFVLMIVEFLLVVAISSGINRFSYATELSLFAVYSFLNGLTLSFVFYIYQIGTIGIAFAVTSVTFGVMAVYGNITKSDLTGFGSLARMFLIGGLITMVINFFIRSSAIDYFISIVLLVVFVGLVAYDTQKLKSYFYATQNDYEMQRKIGVHGALSLYLDFINIFLSILRIFGRRN